MKEKYKNSWNIAFEWLGILTILLIWLISSSLLNKIYLPTISDTFNALINLLSLKSTYEAFGLTFIRTIIAIIISIILGIIFGLLSGLFIKSRKFLTPFLNLMRFIPIPCFIFIISSIFSPNIFSIIISYIVIFPLIYEAIVGGVLNIDENIKNSLRIEGFYRANSIFKVILPLTFPYLNVAIINSVGMGIKISVMSEIIVGRSSIWGIGRLIYVANQNADYPMMFAIVIIIIVIFIIIDAILGVLRRKIS